MMGISNSMVNEDINKKARLLGAGLLLIEAAYQATTAFSALA